LCAKPVSAHDRKALSPLAAEDFRIDLWVVDSHRQLDKHRLIV